MFTQTFEFSQSDLKLRPVDDYALVEEGVYHSASILGEVIVPTPMRYRTLPFDLRRSRVLNPFIWLQVTYPPP